MIRYLLSSLLFMYLYNSSNLQEEFVVIKEGNYIIGERNNQINPRRQLRIRSFSISKTEITNQQFLAFIEATHYITDAEKLKNALTFHPGLNEFEWQEDSTANWRFPFGKKNGGIEDKMNHPVTCISFKDALAYCAWKNVRLPTLIEWEIASRCGTESPYFWGTDASLIHDYANIWHDDTHKQASGQEDYLYTSPVATYKPNPCGLYDMYGNVFEFCGDSPAVFAEARQIAFARGGSWWCSEHSCGFFNSVDIGRVNKRASFSNHGFRVVRIE